MSRKTTTALRAAMIAAVAVICLQSTMTKKAEAIADPYTSSGDPCSFDCVGVISKCLQSANGSHRLDAACSTAYSYCNFNCEHYGSPFTAWWLFTR